MSTEEYETELRTLHLSDVEHSIRLRRGGIFLEHQHRHLTLQELLYLGERSLVTDADFDAWAAENGFNDKDHATLALWWTQREIDFANALKAKAAKMPKKPPAKPPQTPTA